MKQAPGIYAIRNLTDGRHYVGGSQNVSARCISHRWHLRNGQHKNPQLQAAWDLAGEEEFEFVLLEALPTKDVNVLQVSEHRWIQTLGAAEEATGYNLQTGAGEGFTHASSTRFRMSQVRRGRECTSETRQKIACSNQGQIRSEEARERMSVAHSGVTWLVTAPDGTQETITNLSRFCHARGLSESSLRATSSGRVYRHRGGWYCVRLSPLTKGA